MRFWWVTPKQRTGGMALAGGFIALLGIFLDMALASLPFGLGLLLGFGATYCLMDGPEGKDVFPLKVAARLGFLLAGLGVGAFVRELDMPQYIWAFYIAAALPLLSLARLLLRRGREARRQGEEKKPWEEP